MAKLCSECGATLNGGKFCSECGAKIGVSDTIQPTTVLSSENDTILETLFVETGANKVDMCKQYANHTGVSLSEAKSKVDAFMKTKSFSEKLALSAEHQQIGTKRGKAAARERIAENKANGIACCPKCGSTSLSANKKGFGIGKAVLGAALTGGIGLAAGNIGAKKVRITCLNCGHQFWAGK